MENYIVEVISKDENIAKIKNGLIEKNIKNNIQFLFIKQDDVEISNDKVYDEYIKVMNQYKLACTFYGFYKDTNRIFLNNNPNPIVKIKINDKVIPLVRNISDSFICIDLHQLKNIRFNEEYKLMHFEVFLYELFQKKSIPFFGFFFDISDSWDKIEAPTYKNIDMKQHLLEKQEMQIEMQAIQKSGKQMQATNSLDEVIKYIKETNEIHTDRK